MAYHKLLERQIEKYLKNTDLEDHEGLSNLISDISDTYNTYDREKESSQQAFDNTDKEYQEITDKLTREKEGREDSIRTLLKTISDLELESEHPFDYDRTDLMTVAKFLEQQVQMRIKMERELQESEQNFRQINETIEDAFWLFDTEAQKYLYISPSCRQIFGFSQEDFVMRDASVQALLIPGYEHMQEYDWSKVDLDKSYSVEYEIEVDGEVKWILERSFAIRNESGSVVRQSGVFTDISERKQSEVATKAYLKEISNLKSSLEIREEQYRGLVENASDLIFELDGTGKPTYVNQISQPLIGYSNEELYERFFWEIIPKEHAKEFTSKYLDLIKRKVRFSYLEVPIEKKNGEVIWLGQSTTMFFKGDWLYKASVIARDITIQRKHEDEIQKLSEFQQKILDGTDYGFITTSHPSGLITTFNKGAEAMLGYSADEVIGKETPAILHDPQEVKDRARELSQKLNREIVPGVDVFQVRVREGIVNVDVNEWTYILKDGSKITVELAVTALKDKNNVTTGYLRIAKDITQRKKTEKDILQAKEQAEVANRVKSEFLANMSHEIRTPLNGVIGFTDLLSKTILDQTQHKYVSMVSHSADVLLDIINDVLDFAKVEAGKIELDLMQTNVEELCSSVIEMTSPLNSDKNLRQECTVDERVPLVVFADELRLRQVLVNLVANAVKFTTDGSVELVVKFLRLDTDGKAQLRFSIKDTGLGIHQTDQKKIFEAFSQVDASTTKKFGGTGLGLSISNNLLSLMGSQIQLESTLGEGSHFFFDISFDSVANDQAKSQHQSSTGKANTIEVQDLPTPEISEQSAVIIMLVEDNMVNMQVVKFMIKKAFPSVELVEAVNGQDAVDKFHQRVPSFIFMDIQMPEMNGYEATRQIRRIESVNQSGTRIPIVALTAGITKGEREKCLSAGMDDYVSKPVVMDTIIRVLNQWLN